MNKDQEIGRLTAENHRLQGKVEALMEVINAGRRVPVESDDDGLSAFKRLTTKQHQALQIILSGDTNAAIGERLGITESTAKVHVRGLMKKFGAHTRTQVAMAAKGVFERMTDEEYRKLTGIPKTWYEDERAKD